MNSKDNHETNDQSVIIEDLSAQNSEEIKGGPIYMHYEGIDGVVTSSSATSAAGGGVGKVQMQDILFIE